MEEKTHYTVKITPEAEGYYYDILNYFYEHCSEESAGRKSEELLELAISLEKNPSRGQTGEKLKLLGRNHRYLLYYYTPGKAIKLIYYIDSARESVYIPIFSLVKATIQRLVSVVNFLVFSGIQNKISKRLTLVY